MYVVLSLLTDFTNGSFPDNSQTKFYFFSFFTVVEYTLFSIFLSFNFKSKKIKKLILFALPLFYIIVLYYIFNRDQSNNFDAIPASLESILIIIFCVIFFFEQIRDMEVSFIYSSKTFWIIVAILIYMAATFFLFISAEFVSQQERRSYWFINSISNILKNVLLAIAFIIPNYKPRPLEERPFSDELFEYDKTAT
ncbi:hypothetical protein HB364_18665 [Pseudoflavitalea sp. X16]|uniref:hypothetical protein n=1 Tax=Paraflavitalea devenefica TaxID=2716334 RepID=UPI00141E84D9|nr:hypothetical protein [Paraflavitalea devenefica]NII27118.1 hypothetical protein [Paraflavitalea devenefica]